MFVLVVNAGSSSLKYQLFDMDNEQVLAKGLCERIGQDMGGIKHQNLVSGAVHKKELKMENRFHDLQKKNYQGNL